MPGVLLRALSEYKFVGTPLWRMSARMSDGRDLVHVELTFHKALPTKPYYKRKAESRRQPAPSAGEWPRQPAPAARPTTRSTPASRRRRRHHQLNRHCTPQHLPPSDINASHRQQRLHHRQPSWNLLHRLPLQNHHRRRSQELSRQRRTLHPRSTFMSTLRKSSLYIKSTSSRVPHLRSSRPSQKLQDYQETTKRSTSIYQSTLSTTETTSIGLSSRDLLQSSMM